jgi:hypothetical protein
MPAGSREEKQTTHGKLEMHENTEKLLRITPGRITVESEGPSGVMTACEEALLEGQTGRQGEPGTPRPARRAGRRGVGLALATSRSRREGVRISGLDPAEQARGYRGVWGGERTRLPAKTIRSAGGARHRFLGGSSSTLTQSRRRTCTRSLSSEGWSSRLGWFSGRFQTEDASYREEHKCDAEEPVRWSQKGWF